MRAAAVLLRPSGMRPGAHGYRGGRSVAAPAAATLLLASLLLALPHGAEAKPKRKINETEKQEMAKHSFTSPLNYDTQLGEWMMSAASISMKDRVLLTPGVPDRHGFMFHKKPILTNDFEVIAHFKQAGEKETPKRPQAFAFWYAFENVSSAFDEPAIIKSANWTTGQQAQGFTLAGGKAKWHGLGCVFSPLDRKRVPKPTLTGVWNTGAQEFAYLHENPDSPDAIPNAKSKYVDFRNTLNYAQLQVRVRPNSVVGSVKLSPSLSWMKAFEIEGISVPKGGYIGFTSYTGGALEAGKADAVTLLELEVYNYDFSVIAEQSDVSKDIQETYQEMLNGGQTYNDQKSQTEALQRLSRMVSQHIANMKPIEDNMLRQMNDLQLKMHSLEEGTKVLRKEIGIFVGNQSRSTVSSMKTELVGLRSVFTRDSQAHTAKLESVQKTVQEAKQAAAVAGAGPKVNVSALEEIVAKSQDLEKTVQDSSRQTSWVMIMVILAAVVIGALMWQRMRYYEKKHFL